MAITLDNETITRTLARDDWQANNSYRFHLLLIPEDDGQWSATVLNLPGIGSCGDTEEDAIVNAKEAIRGALAAYGSEIPWKVNDKLEDAPKGSKQRWIILDA